MPLFYYQFNSLSCLPIKSNSIPQILEKMDSSRLEIIANQLKVCVSSRNLSNQLFLTPLSTLRPKLALERCLVTTPPRKCLLGELSFPSRGSGCRAGKTNTRPLGEHW